MPQFIKLSATIPSDYQGMRIDQALAQLFPEHSRARLSGWLKNKQVTVDGQHLRPKDKVCGGEHVEIKAQVIDHGTWLPQDIDVEVVFEDEQLIIINKPVGLVVHPAAGNPDNTLVNALLHHCPTMANLPRAGLIHRLDKDTSGLLIAAKTLEAYTFLVSAMQQRLIKREYQALAYGKILTAGTINAPMGRHPRNRLKMAVVSKGKSAITHFTVLRNYQCCTLLEVRLETGRTHQIRVHLAHINHPLVGDQLYNAAIPLAPANAEIISYLKQFKRQALHAFRLSFIHPFTKKPLLFSVAMPQDMQQLLEILDDKDGK